MAELLAIGQDLKNLTPTYYKTSEGGINISLTGNSKYRPELRLSRSEINTLVSLLQEKPKEEVKIEEKQKTSNVLVGIDSGGWSGKFIELASNGIKYFRTSSNYHNIIPEALSAGMKPISVIFGEGGTIGNINPSTYSKEVLELVEKYDLEAVEVLNEPGGSWFWSDPTNYQGYVNLLKAVYQTVNGKTKILASWDGGRVEPNTIYGREWARLGGLNYCDEVTVHPYGGNSGQCGGAFGDRKKIEQAHLESSKPVAITEVGWPTAIGQPATGDSQQWTETQQANNITNLYKWCAEKDYITRFVVFNYEDYGTNNFYGIRNNKGIRKLSYSALTSISSTASL
jgi:hypothetical protein